MNLPLSQMIYSKFRETPSARRVITLHRHNAFYENMRDVGLAASPDGTVLGVQASKGVYFGRTIVGYIWYVGPLDRPSPVHFGDAMQEIERFLWDEIDRQQPEAPVLPFLIGEEQGAIMALAMAAAVPALLSGVVTIEARVPIVPGWEPSLAPLTELPILLVNPVAEALDEAKVLIGDRLVSTLPDWGGDVSVLDEPISHGFLPSIADWVAKQESRTYHG